MPDRAARYEYDLLKPIRNIMFAGGSYQLLRLSGKVIAMSLPGFCTGTWIDGLDTAGLLIFCDPGHRYGECR
ncbi:MAG: hypothetical protein MUF37_05470 [Methanoregulaceae archaeon]|nr:hypothetical protein [Methanoregulaceae archaeon]